MIIPIIAGLIIIAIVIIVFICEKRRKARKAAKLKENAVNSEGTLNVVNYQTDNSAYINPIHAAFPQNYQQQAFNLQANQEYDAQMRIA